MSNEYGQQPPMQQGYGQPQQYGYPQTPPGGQPVYPGQQPYRGGYGYAPNEKPGSVTGAAVLGFVQAGVTLITTGIMFSALFSTASVQDSGAGVGWALAIAQLVGLILLIFGSVQLLSGTSRVLYVVGAIVELALCAYYLAVFLAADSDGSPLGRVLEDFANALAVIPAILAIMPLIGLVLALGSAASTYLAAKRGR
jgi:hypothetical protein